MSLSNKELLDKTLFLKDSVLFISIDGKDYEVSNPEAVATNKLYFIDVYPTLEWPGGVELIEHYYDKNKGKCGITMCYSQSENIKDKCLKWCKTIARLLPKEKKENKICIASHSPISTQAESDYQQFEGKNLHIVTPESSEPQEKRTESDMVHCGGINCPFEYSCVDGCMYPKPIISAPVESQEELWGEVISECRIYDGTPTYFLMLQKRLSERFSITRLTP